MEIKPYLKKINVDFTIGDTEGANCSNYGEFTCFVNKTHDGEYLYNSYYNIVNILYHKNQHSLDFKAGIIFYKLKDEQQYIRHYKILQLQTEHKSYSKTTGNFKAWCVRIVFTNYLKRLRDVCATTIRENPYRYKNDSYLKSLIKKYNLFVFDARKRFKEDFNSLRMDCNKYYQDRVYSKKQGECNLYIQDSFEGLIQNCGFKYNKFYIELELVHQFHKWLIPNIDKKIEKGGYIKKETGKSYYVVYKNNDKKQKIIIRFNCSDWDKINFIK